MSLIEVGAVARAHGVRGELRVRLHNPGSRALEDAGEVWIGGVRHRVERCRPVEGAVLLLVDDIADRDAAAALRGAAVEVEREALDLDEGEVLLIDLVGCRVELPDGAPWGEVVRVETGPQDRLVIRDGDVEREIPLVDELVTEIDLEAGRVVVDPPEGIPETPISR